MSPREDHRSYNAQPWYAGCTMEAEAINWPESVIESHPGGLDRCFFGGVGVPEILCKVTIFMIAHQPTQSALQTCQ